MNLLKLILIPFKLIKKYKLKQNLKKQLKDLLEYRFNPRYYTPGYYSYNHYFNVLILVKTINKIDKL